MTWPDPDGTQSLPPEPARPAPGAGLVDPEATRTDAGGGGAQGAAARVGARGAVEVPPSLYARFEGFTLIGRGGMGAVYKARDLRLGRDVAIKLLFEPDPQGGLLREARSQARLRHPRVCEVYEAGVADQVPFIVMRFVAGASLGEAQKDMTLEEKVRIVREIALALHEAHRIGIVHRDVKPSNILVERREDGEHEPYIADFGIARDIGQGGGATLTNAVQGTPAFMSPEQAAGKTRSIDRRSDVYSLGATLYDTLCGRPPFTAPTLLTLLRMVVEADPAKPRALAPEVPADLEAVVMKCLEKDPAARYDSARALAEDLRAFLDGDPVTARMPSLGARLWRRARRHRGKVLAGALLAAAGLSVAGLRIRDQRVADERAALSRELGGSVREMELFLRNAAAMPLHDVERERDVVRARLRDIEARMAQAGEIAVGPGNDALGRGHLALQEPRAALDHFERAAEVGYSAPGLRYAMGLAQIELYREALQKASRFQKASDREAFTARIEREHREPALLHLRAALAQGVESPAYAHGLIALHEGRLEEALERAREAFEAAPWLVEAKKLEGDVLRAMGSRTGHDKAFDHARAMAHFEQATAAYREAEELSRSDPAIHEAECELWIGAMNAAAEAGDSMRPGFERAKAACERAIRASPRRASSHLHLAFAYNCFAFWVASGMRAEDDPDRALSEAAERVEAAARMSPEDAFARYQVGAVWRSRAIFEVQSGRDGGAAIDRAMAGYDAALSLDPGFLWALNEACATLALRGQREAVRGADPGATFGAALGLCGRAIEIDPEFLFPWNNTIMVRCYDAERLAAAGLSPAPAVEEGLRVALAAERHHPSWRWLPYWRARLHRSIVEYKLERGEDPGGALADAEALLPQLAALRGAFADAAAAEGQILAVKAEALLAAPGGRGAGGDDAKDGQSAAGPGGGDGQSAAAAAGSAGGLGAGGASPALEAALSGARAALAAAREQTPWDPEYSMWLTRVEVAELRYRLALGAATEAHAEAVLAPLAPFLREPREDPSLYEAAARAREARADRLRRLGRDDAAEAAAAVALAGKAAALGPGSARAKALLERLRRRAREP